MTSENPDKSIPVFYEGQSLAGEPYEYLTREEAGLLVKDHEAWWVNHGKAIRRKRYQLRDTSATMGPRVIESAARGSKRHKAVVLEWAPTTKEKSDGHQNDARHRTIAG